MEPIPPGSGGRELIEILLTLGRLRRTGILTVQSDQQIIGVTFLEGEIVSADALNESLEEGLGRVLASRELVSVEDFASLMAEHEAGGGQVTDLLVERNFLTREQLSEALVWHNYLLCRETLEWDAVEYKFYPGSEVSHVEGIRPLSVEELLVRAVEDLGEQAPLAGPIPSLEAVFERSEGELVAAQDELMVGLVTGDSEGSADLIEEIDGERSVGDIALAVGLSAYEARLMVYLMERTGNVRPVVRGTDELLSSPNLPAAATVARARASVAGIGARWLGKRSGRSRERSAARERQEIDWSAWPARLLGIAAFLIVVMLAWSDPARFLLPFPWQESLRRAVVDEQTSAAYLKIDRAAKTAFLLDGHFPAALDELVANDYLTPRDLVDPLGRRLGYASQVAGYLLYLEDEGDVAPGTSRTETITGNFLLDPEFVPESRIEVPPLVLLD